MPGNIVETLTWFLSRKGPPIAGCVHHNCGHGLANISFPKIVNPIHRGISSMLLTSDLVSDMVHFLDNSSLHINETDSEVSLCNSMSEST
jgi:hypothetical protein